MPPPSLVYLAIDTFNESNCDVRPTRPTSTDNDRTTDRRDDGGRSVHLFDLGKLRIQGRMQMFEKSALNHGLTLATDSISPGGCILLE